MLGRMYITKEKIKGISHYFTCACKSEENLTVCHSVIHYEILLLPYKKNLITEIDFEETWKIITAHNQIVNKFFFLKI